MRAPLLIAVAAVAAACYTGPAPGRFLCGDNGACPEGQVCTGGICLLPGQEPDLAVDCVPSLSGVGTTDFFSITFTIKTKATAQSTVLYQRTGCDAIHDFWAVTLQPMGVLSVEINEANAGKYTAFSTTAPVSDGKPHAVLFRRAQSVLTSTTDGAPSGSASAMQRLGALPPLGIARGNPCEAGGLKPLDGTVTEVCLSIGRSP